MPSAEHAFYVEPLKCQVEECNRPAIATYFPVREKLNGGWEFLSPENPARTCMNLCERHLPAPPMAPNGSVTPAR